MATRHSAGATLGAGQRLARLGGGGTVAGIMRILAFDAALARCSAAAMDGTQIRAETCVEADRGHASVLPRLVASVLAEAGWQARTLDLVAVTVGPGSFTGIRAALSLALGIGLSAGVTVAGVTVGEAFAAAAGTLSGRVLWSAIDSKRGRVFIERDGTVIACALDAVPVPDGPIALVGDAAAEVAARLRATGADVLLTELRLPRASMVAKAALRIAGTGAPSAPAAALRGRARDQAARSAAPAAARAPMSAGDKIVRASAACAEPLALVHAAAFPAAERWTAEAIAGLLAMPACFGLLHPAGGMLLGRAMAEEAEVLTVAVAPDARRRGIGTALIARAVGEASARGARSLFLEVSAENAPARQLYGAAGFTEIGRRRGYYAGGADALVMKRALRDHAEDEAG